MNYGVACEVLEKIQLMEGHSKVLFKSKVPITKFSTALDWTSKSNDFNVNKRTRYINFTRNTSWMTTKMKYVVMEAVVVVVVESIC